MLCSRQTSKTAWPLSAARKMRILSSVVYRLPFILDPFSWPQTNTTSGSKKRGHVRRIGAAEFGEFLKRLMQGAKRPIFLVVDCHSIHRSQQVRHLLQRLKGRLRLFYLPPYSPELNPDELVWNDLKNQAVGRMVLRGPAELKYAVVSHLRFLQRTPELIRSFFQTATTAYAAV